MNTKDRISHDVTRTTLAVLFIAILTAAAFWILRAFLTPIVWAAIIVVATWPVMLSTQAVLWNRRGLAVAVMSIALLLVIVVPLTLAVTAIAGKSGDIASRVRSLSAFTVPPPPEWVGRIPLAGGTIDERWQRVAALSPEELAAQITPYAKKAAHWFIAKAGSVATLILQFLLTVIIAAIMYAKGETAAAGIRSFARRLAGERGEETAVLAAKATRSVALSIVVTAGVQSGLGGVGLFFTGVPAAPLLTAVMLILCLAQLGPVLVLVPSVIWLFVANKVVLAIVLLVFTVVAGTIDNFLRPLLIRRGVDLSLILIFAGVIGGLMAFGVIGLFIGPVVLAVTFMLLQKWVAEQ